MHLAKQTVNAEAEQKQDVTFTQGNFRATSLIFNSRSGGNGDAGRKRESLLVSNNQFDDLEVPFPMTALRSASHRSRSVVGVRFPNIHAWEVFDLRSGVRSVCSALNAHKASDRIIHLCIAKENASIFIARVSFPYQNGPKSRELGLLQN